MSVKGNHPLAEILAKKLFGINQVPDKERTKMANRAVKAAIEYHEKHCFKAGVVDFGDMDLIKEKLKKIYEVTQYCFYVNRWDIYGFGRQTQPNSIVKEVTEKEGFVDFSDIKKIVDEIIEILELPEQSKTCVCCNRPVKNVDPRTKYCPECAVIAKKVYNRAYMANKRNKPTPEQEVKVSDIKNAELCGMDCNNCKYDDCILPKEEGDCYCPECGKKSMVAEIKHCFGSLAERTTYRCELCNREYKEIKKFKLI